jgi:hypothetical protein
MKDKLEQIIEQFYADSGMMKSEIVEIELIDKYRVTLSFERLGTADTIRMLPCPNTHLNIVWSEDVLTLIQSVTKDFINDYVLCDKCEDTGWVEEIYGCHKSASDCCGGCTIPVKCECKN